MRVLTMLGMCGILFTAGAVASSGQVQETTGSKAATAEVTSPPADSFQTFRTGEYRELLAKLQHRPEITITTVSPYDSPIELAEARVKGLDRDLKVPRNDDTEPSTFEPYVMSATILVVNRTDKRITEALLQFVDSGANNTFFMRMSSRPPDTWLEPGKSRLIKVDLMALPYDPSNLSVQVAEVLVEGGDKWGPREVVAPHPGYPRISKNIGPVDTRPLSSNRVRPAYSEEARRWGITGSARLELQVGADGIPSVTDILSRLPAGLTRQAVRAAGAMRFNPAIRNGAPVPYYVVIEVGFNLR
jgi:TonB family protein